MVDAGILRVSDPCSSRMSSVLFSKQLDHFSATWNSHRIRQQNQSTVISDKPDILFYQPEIFGTHDYSLEPACSAAAVDLLVDQYSDKYYKFGCREEFLQIIELLFPLTRFEKAQSLFINMISKLEEFNV